jgi:hypothetical protein
MNSVRILSLGVFLWLYPSPLSAAEAPATLAKPLEPLRPFIDKTWKGHFKNSTPEKPMIDVARWERALNGQAVRILHSINDGVYGGESIVMWNPKSKRLEFHYFTTAGFQTHGSMTIEGAKLISREEVVGNRDGVTEVRATTELLADGKMRVQSRYLKKGQWLDGHEVTYEVAPPARVVFK